MPEIAQYVKELLEEDEFGTNFHSKIDDRVHALNVSQLQRMEDHLLRTAATSNFHIWREANEKVESHFGDFIRARMDEIERKEREEYEKERKRAAKLAMKNSLQGEAERVKRFTEQHTMELAKKQILDEERQRKAEERLEFRKNSDRKERIRMMIAIAGCIVLAGGISIAVAALSSNVFIMAGIIVGSVIIAGFIFIAAYLAGRQVPKKVTLHDLQALIDKRQAELRFAAETEILQKEEEYHQLQIAEKEERRKRVKEAKERRELEAQLAQLETRQEREEHIFIMGMSSQYSLLSDSPTPSMRQLAINLNDAAVQRELEEMELGYGPGPGGGNVNEMSVGTFSTFDQDAGQRSMQSMEASDMSANNMAGGFGSMATAGTNIVTVQGTLGSGSNSFEDRVKGSIAEVHPENSADSDSDYYGSGVIEVDSSVISMQLKTKPKPKQKSSKKKKTKTTTAATNAGTGGAANTAGTAGGNANTNTKAKPRALKKRASRSGLNKPSLTSIEDDNDDDETVKQVTDISMELG